MKLSFWEIAGWLIVAPFLIYMVVYIVSAAWNTAKFKTQLEVFIYGKGKERKGKQKQTEKNGSIRPTKREDGEKGK